MSIMLVRRRQTVNRAMAWTGDEVDLPEVREFLGPDYAGTRPSDRGLLLLIHTLEHRNAPYEAAPDSVILEGVRRREHWAVAPIAFYDSYEKIGEEE
jgi:hypothetical protein